MEVLYVTGVVCVNERHKILSGSVAVGVFTQPSTRWSYKHLNISRHTRIRSYTLVAVIRRVCVLYVHARAHLVLNILRGTSVTGAVTMHAAAEERFPETLCTYDGNVNRRRPFGGGNGDERDRYPLVAPSGR